MLMQKQKEIAFLRIYADVAVNSNQKINIEKSNEWICSSYVYLYSFPLGRTLCDANQFMIVLCLKQKLDSLVTSTGKVCNPAL